MANDELLKLQEHEIPLEMKGHFPPDISALHSAGFDSISSSRSSVALRKVQTRDMAGRPVLFLEIILRKNSATLRYSLQPWSEPRLRLMACGLQFLRVLSLVKGYKAPLQQFSNFILPAIEAAAGVASEPYMLLSKKFSDAAREASELSEKNARLSAFLEEEAAARLEMSAQLSQLSARVEKLQSVSDEALREMVLEWLRSHRGTFNAAQFSSANAIPPARCEEGLEALLRDGTVRRIGKGFAFQQGVEDRAFLLGGKEGVISLFLGKSNKRPQASRLPQAD